MPVLKAKASEGQKLDPGTYEIVVVDAKEDVLEKPQFGNGEVLRLTLRIVDVVDPEGEEIVLDAIANLKLSPLSKLWGWIEAFGFKLQIGQDFDTDQLVGLNAYAVVGQREGQDGALWPRVESIIPLPKNRKPAPEVDTDDIGAWWAITRKQGFERNAVLEKSKELFDGREPADLTAPERAKLMAALT